MTYNSSGNLTSTINALNQTTQITAYDPHGRPLTVQDPNGLVTNLSYDLRGRLVSRSVGGEVTGYQYDGVGNLISQKDARNLTTTYTYDALNRITKATYADGASTVYQYDTGVNSIGRLNKLTDQSGGNILTTQWSYDARGRVIQKQQQIFGMTQTLRYSYNAQGQLSSMTYPSGKVINYSYTQAKLSSLSLGTTPLLSNLQYQAFGPPKGWSWGNNTVYSRGFDQDGRLVGYPLGSSTRTLGYDAASRITAYTESTAANNQSFGYDSLDRLTNFTGLGASQGFTYDGDGNRLTQTQGASTSRYTYPSTSNRLSQVSGPSPKTFSYDAMGNLLADGTNTYSYNARGRLSYVSYNNRSNAYHHNGLGQRVAKSGWLAITDFNIYAYDEQGHLIGEYDAYGAPIQETVYLGDTPVAVLGGTTPAPVVYPIYTDHLNTSRVITDQTNKVIWNWTSDPFGTTPVNEDPDGDGVKFTYNLRFPGQYYDRETGLHYNYFRDYDPRIGRYVESDPIGLDGGINTYTYTNNNPIKYSDSRGLLVETCCGMTSEMPHILVQMALECMSKCLKAPILISSGWRTEEQNQRAPGSADNSYHLDGLAADIHEPPPQDKLRKAAAHCGLYVLPKKYPNRIHVDIRNGSLIRTEPDECTCKKIREG